MTRGFQTVLEHFDHHGFRYEVRPEGDRIHAVFRGAKGVYNLFVKTDDHLLQVFAIPGFRVPKGSLCQVAEVVCRANYGLKVGKFEMDYEDGEVRYQASTCLFDGQLTDEMIRIVIGATISTLDRYLPAILSCIYANEEPRTVIRHAELSLHGQDDTDEA